MGRLPAAVCLLSAMTVARPPVTAASEPVRFAAAGEGAPMLEGELSLPELAAQGAPVPGVVICHPNPLMGGAMRNNVVRGIRDRCLELGMATLIFNFRGVGRSAGEPTDGSVCADDVRGALAFMRAQSGIDPARIGLAGYSFGAQMALAAMSGDHQVVACAAVGLPTGLEQPVTVADFAYLDGLDRPLLFVTGTRDQYSAIASILALVDHYHLQARVIPLEGTDHFFADPRSLATMATQTAHFLATHLARPR